MFERLRHWYGAARTPSSPVESGDFSQDRKLAIQAYTDGLRHFQAGDLVAAERQLNDALACSDELVEVHYYLGLIYRKRGSLEDAHDALSLATKRAPDFHKAWFYLGIVEIDLERYGDASNSLNTALRIRPNDANAHNGLGVLFQVQSRYRLAENCFKRAIELNPNLAAAYSNLANVTLHEYLDADAAFQHAKKAVDINPLHAGAHESLAMILQYQGRCEEALIECERSLKLNPGSTQALWVRALAGLMVGRYARGWEDYEIRKRILPIFRIRNIPLRDWDGSPLEGLDVLVYNEQGLGDEIMFASCLPDLFALGGRYVIECSAKLERLFKRSFPRALIQVVDQRQSDLSYLKSLPAFAWKIAAGSLPRFFRKEHDDFIGKPSFLRADPDRATHWRACLNRMGAGPKIGLSWRGGQVQTNRSRRSMTLEDLVPLLSIPECVFVSLQYDDCLHEIEEVSARHRVVLHHWQEAIDDYDETAALVSALDLVVSVQTAVVHLGGALGRPVWALVPSTPEWRYMLEGERMPWYPSVRLFRQARGQEWAPVVFDVVRNLILHFASSASASKDG